MTITEEVRKKMNQPAYFADATYKHNPCVNCLKPFTEEDEMKEIEYVICSEGELRWWHWVRKGPSRAGQHGCN